MTQRWMYEDAPLDLIATRREELSDVLRNGVRLDAEDRHWLGVWIREYDKAIALLNDTPNAPGEGRGRAEAASRQSVSKALLGEIRTAWCHYNALNAELEYSLSEGGDTDVTRDQVEHAWEDLNSLIMPNATEHRT